MRAVLVPHTHWDREWYRTFQAFRARLVDAVDVLLDLCAADPGYRFLLDGQTAVLEDYAEIRPDRVAELRQRCGEGRIAIGPWYVQPDSLLPAGESHVRNLLEGRRAGASFGPVSRIAYTPDSFGHPAQLPQLLRGFGLRAFVYWRGNGAEIDELPAEYRWVAPDGSSILACHLARGYFSAAIAPGADLGESLPRVAQAAKELAARTRSGAILLLCGIDHAAPEPRTAELAEALARASGFQVERGLLEDFVDAVAEADPQRPRFAGELVGGRLAPLLPGVWSTRSWIKLANRSCESLLLGWAEPFAALARRFGAPDERPALRLAWRELLRNQAHDSLCGCSRDEVHQQMRARFDAARELAEETTARALCGLAAARLPRMSPWSDDFEVAVFNPSPHVRTEVLRFPLDPHPTMVPAPRPQDAIHPWMLQDLSQVAFEAEGAPLRRARADVPGRPTLLPDRASYELEWVVRDLPPFGWKRVRLQRRPASQETEEEVCEVAPGSSEASIQCGALCVQVQADGRFTLRHGERAFPDLAGVEDRADRGDSYDCDPLEGPPLPPPSLRVRRRRHPAGLQRLEVERCWRVPEGLLEDRQSRGGRQVPLHLWMELRLAEGVPRLDGRIRLWNQARDHRLRLLFPLPDDAESVRASSTFDLVSRGAELPDGDDWVQPPQPTFVHQGLLLAGGLSLHVPGLPEAEWIRSRSSHVLAVTLLRAVGHLSRHDLHTRRGPAGPGSAVPEAQVPGLLEARFSLWPSGPDAAAELARAWDSELGVRASALAGEERLPEGRPLLRLAPESVLLSALKPAERGDGLLIRLLNPGEREERAELTLGFPFQEARCVGLDESPSSDPLERSGSRLRLTLSPHALRSLLIR